MDSVEHAAQLQYLLSHSQAPDFATNFTRFVYYQCSPKIRQRLALPVLEPTRQFKDLFSRGTINDVDLRSRLSHTGGRVLDEKVLRQGEEWISAAWTRLHGVSPAFEQCDGTKYLVYDETTVVKLHHLIREVFAHLWDGIEKVQLAHKVYRTPEVATDAYITEIQQTLDGVGYYMCWLARLVRSPCFWKHLQHPALQEWVSDQYSSNLNQASGVRGLSHSLGNYTLM